MDTTAQNTAQNAQQPVQPNDQTQPTPVQQPVSQPVSVPAGKESAPVVIPKPQEQWVEETAKEATVEAELQEVGVEAKKGEVINIPKEVTEAGVTPSGAATPIPVNPQVKFPMTEEKVEETLKKNGVWNSAKWFAMLILRQFQMVQFNQKAKEKAA